MVKKRFSSLVLALFAGSLFGTGSLFAANGSYDHNGTGDQDWVSGGTNGDDDWSGAEHPGFAAAETATFDGSDTVTGAVNVAAAPANAVTIEVNNGDAVIDLADGVDLLVTDLTYTTANSISFTNTAGGGASVTLSGLTNPGAAGTLVIGANVTLNVNGAADFTGFGTVTNNGIIAFDSTGGTFTASGVANLNGVITSNAAGNDINLSGNLSAASLSVTGSNTTAVTLDLVLSGNLSVTDSLFATGGNADVDGDLSVSSSAAGNTTRCDISGNLDVDGSTTLSADTLDATIDVNGTAGFDAITLNAGANAGTTTLDVATTTLFREATNIVNGDTVTLTGDVTFEGAATQSVDAGDKLAGNVIIDGNQVVTFSTATTLGGNITVNDGASVAFGDTISFGADVNVGDGSTLSASAAATLAGAGTFRVDDEVASVNFASTLDIDGATVFDNVNSDASASPTAGVINVVGQLNIGADVSDNNGAGLDGAANIVLGADLSFDDVAGLAFSLDESALDFTGSAAQQVVAAGTTNFDTASINLGDVLAGQSVTLAGFDQATTSFVLAGLEISDTFTFDSATFDLTFTSDIETNASGVFAQTGLTAGTDGNLTFDSTNGNWMISGTAATFAGDVTVQGANRVEIAIGSTATFTGDITVNAGAFGSDEDGNDTQNARAGADATDGQLATLNLNGDLTVGVAGGLLIGEGTLNIGADLDLSGVDSAIAFPESTLGGGDSNDSDSVINLTGTTAVAGVTQTLAFSANGSIFVVDSVVAASSIRQTGLMLLVGDLNLSASTATTVWDGSDDSAGAAEGVQLGLNLFGESDSATEEAAMVTTGNGNVVFAAVNAVAVDNGSTDEFTVTAFTRSASTTGTYTFASLTLEGDPTDDNAGDDINSPTVVISGAELTVSGTVTVNAGNNDDRGATFEVENATLTLADLTLPAAGAGANFANLEIDGSTVTFSDGATLSVGANNNLEISASTLTSSGSDAYTVTVDPALISGEVLDSTVSAGAADGLTVTLGGADLEVINTDFSNYDAAGVNFAATTTLTTFNDNTFTGGQAAGTHLTFNGLGNATYLNADANFFDDSVDTANGGGGGAGTLASAAAGANRLNFRAGSAGFGTTGVTFSAANAESFDDDGDGAGGTGVDGDITWDDSASTLTVALTSTTPTSLVANQANTGSTKQTIALFDVSAAGADIDVTGFNVTLDGEDLTAGDITSGTAGDIVLFVDTNTDGIFDAGEEIDDDPGATIAAGANTTVNFAPAAAQTVTDGTTQVFGVALLTTAAAVGTITVEVDVNAVTTAGTEIISGLPVEQDVTVTQPAADLTVSTVAAVNAAGNLGGALDGKQVLLALDIANSGTGNATLSQLQLQLDADWVDTAAFDANDAFDAITAFVDGTAAAATNDGDDTLSADGTDDEQLGTVASGSITIDAGTGNSAGGDETVTVTLAFGTNNLVVNIGVTKRIYFIVDVTATSADFTAARTRQLDLALSLQDSATITTTNAGDVIQALASAVQGRLLVFRLPSSDDDDDSSCSLVQGTSGNGAIFLWAMLGVLGLVVVSSRFVSLKR